MIAPFQKYNLSKKKKITFPPTSQSMSKRQPDATLPKGPFSPRYRKIRADIESLIQKGHLAVGSQVPTEQQLCEQYGVSRITARRALEELRAANLIERIAGRGSFVRATPKSAHEAATEVAIIAGVTATDVQENSVDQSWGLHIIRTLSDYLITNGFHPTLLSSENADLFWSRIDRLSPRLSGVVGFATHIPKHISEGLDQRSIPWISINVTDRLQTHNFVAVENFGANQELASILAAMGYRKLLYISTGLRTISNSERLYGLMQGWAEAGKPLKAISHFEVKGSDGLTETEILALQPILSGNGHPDAIVCSGDLIAAGVVKMCHQLSIRIPDDIAVIGGTGMPLAEHLTPSLTVLEQPMAELGTTAGAMIIEMIRSKVQRIPGRYISSQLISRESCPVKQCSVSLLNSTV